MRHFIFWGIGFLLLMPVAAGADIEGVYLLNNESQMVVHYRDDNHIRVDMNDRSYLLITAATVYALTRSGEGWMAMDMSQMAGIASMLGGNKNLGNWTDLKFTPTGQAETVAGYKGQVYIMQINNGQETQTRQVVMSRHGDVVSLQKALMRMSERTAKVSGFARELDFKSMQEKASADKIGGMLRVENAVELKSIRQVNRSLAFYQLPPNAKTMDMPALFGPK